MKALRDLELEVLPDGGSRLYISKRKTCTHTEDDEVYIHGRSHYRQYVFSSTLEEVFFKENP